MANNNILKNAISAVIKENGNNEITGEVLKNALISIINHFGAGAVFRGVAIPATVPENTDVVGFYLATQNGTYSNFGGYVNTNNKLVVFSNISGTFSKVLDANIKGEALLNGEIDPTIDVGNIGDFYLNKTTMVLFGAKTVSGWGDGVDLKSSPINNVSSIIKDRPLSANMGRAINTKINRLDFFETNNISLGEMESGYYNAAGAGVSSTEFMRTKNPIDVSKIVSIIYTGQMGGVSTYGVVWVNDSGTVIGTTKLGDSTVEKYNYEDYEIIKINGATKALITFYTKDGAAYSLKGVTSLIDQYKVSGADLFLDFENGLYYPDGSKVSSGNWRRTKNPVSIKNVDKLTLSVRLSGVNGSILFYNESLEQIGVITSAQIGEGVQILTLIQAIEQSGIIDYNLVKYINACSYMRNPSLIDSTKYYDIAKLSEVKELIPETIEKDYYNPARALAVDISILDRNTIRQYPDYIPNGSLSWWCYPCCMQLRPVDFVGNSSLETLVGWVHSKGDQFVSKILSNKVTQIRDIKTKCVSPLDTFATDEHNVPAFHPLSDGRLLIAQSGHYDTNYLEVRITDSFYKSDKIFKLQTNGACTYQQIAVLGNKIVIFTRDAQYRWSYFFSTDNGTSWSSCLPFLNGVQGQRAYMRIQRSGGDYLKIYWYPSADELENTFVRYCEVNLNTGAVLSKIDGVSLGNIYNGSVSIPLYTGGVKLFDNTDFPTRRIRLLDTSGNTRDKAVFVVATIPGLPADNLNGDYRIIEYDFILGAYTERILCDYGKKFLNSINDYMGGVCFEQNLFGEWTGNVYLARFGTSNVIYNPDDPNNKYRVEMISQANNITLIDEAEEQLFRPFVPQWVEMNLTSQFRIKCLYMKGSYTSFGRYVSKIMIYA